MWTLQNMTRERQGQSPLDETIYDESFWMGVDVPDDDVYDADAEGEDDNN